MKRGKRSTRGESLRDYHKRNPGAGTKQTRAARLKVLELNKQDPSRLKKRNEKIKLWHTKNRWLGRKLARNNKDYPRRWTKEKRRRLSISLKKRWKSDPSLYERLCKRNSKVRKNKITSLEKNLRYALRRSGIRYRRESILKPYIVDFLLVDYKIALEADGEPWHTTFGKGSSYYRNRDLFIKRKYGVKVVRLKDKVINKRTTLLAKILSLKAENEK